MEQRYAKIRPYGMLLDVTIRFPLMISKCWWFFLSFLGLTNTCIRPKLFEMNAMLPRHFLVRLTAATLVLGARILLAAEYFVSANGNDTQDGRSREQAFATIQRGVDALAAGDTLTILPGEYFENVRRANLGNAEVATVIRAAIPGTAVIRGDVPAPEFTSVDGYRFVYSAPFKQTPLAVIEHDTLRILSSRSELAELEFMPGSFHYDSGAQRLYISPSDLQTTAGRRYTITVKTGSGLLLERPVHVLIDGLAATGFAAPSTGWHVIRSWSSGLALSNPAGCTIRRARVWLNHGGITLLDGPDNRIDDCLAFGNHAHNIHVRGGSNNRDNVIENSYAYRSASGMHFYAGMAGLVILRDNRAWGHNLDFSNKGGGGGDFGRVKRCVGLSNFQAHNLEHTIMAGVNEYDRRLGAPENNILFQRETDLDLDREFVDPYNLDFRLQADSRFRGRDGAPDRGPYPYAANVYFLSPEGSDEHDGLDMSRPRQRLAAMLPRLEPGDTLYLTAGSYSAGEFESLGSAGAESINIRARGNDTVIINGGLTIKNGAGLEFERLTFTGTLHLEGGGGIAAVNCRFTGDGGLRAQELEGLTVRHCLFSETSLTLADSRSVIATANFFANPSGPAIIVSGANPFVYLDYNGYQFPDRVVQGEGAVQALSEVRSAGLEHHATVLPPGSPTHAGWGQGGALGPHDEFATQPIALAGPYLHRADDTTAHVEWWSSEPVGVELTWQADGSDQTDGLKLPETLRYPNQYGGASLTGLEPGTDYTLQMRLLENATTPSPQPLRFTTTAHPPDPREYHVAPDGDDGRDGLSRASAFRTIGRAAAAAGPGDTVLISGGNYPETVRLRAGGTAERPLKFRAAPGERVAVQTFAAIGKQHLHFDGFYLSRGISLYQCDTVAITRCWSQNVLVQATASPDVRVSNSVATQGYPFSGVHIRNSPRFRLENCVIFSPSIYGAVVENQADQRVNFHNTIFVDSIPFKARIQYFEIGRAESLDLRNNCYYMRAPDPEMNLPKRNMFLFYHDEAFDRSAAWLGMETSDRQPSRITELSRLCLDDYEAMFGDTASFMMDPRFQGAPDVTPGARFTEDDNLRNRNNTGFLILNTDRMGRNIDFPALFTTRPELIERGIGLQPDAFTDFHFNR